MKHYPSDKYNVAWFKLAECVSRGEKERALGVYRLLSHSIIDKAYALKLEGDILSAFNDETAAKRYQAALVAYCDQGRLREAVAMSEYLAAIQHSDRELLEQLVVLYEQLGDQKKLVYAQLQLMSFLMQEGDFEALEYSVKKYTITALEGHYVLFKNVIIYYVLHKDAPRSIGVELLKQFLACLSQMTNSPELHQFLNELETLSQFYYDQALDFLTQITE